MDELASVFNGVRHFAVSITFLIGLIVAFRIYRKWNHGEEVEEALYYWVVGLFMCSLLISLVSKLFGL
jgi:uncharacterized protein YybS (DUF2232 family)